jgi:hypothetical protein
MSEEKKYPKGYNSWEDAIDFFEEMKQHCIKFSKLSHKKDEAVQVKITMNYRQWDEKKGKFV